jgi:hypothetical protein
MDEGEAPAAGAVPADLAGAAPQAMFNPFGTLGVLVPARPPPTVEPTGEALPSLLVLVVLAAGIALLLRKALQ